MIRKTPSNSLLDYNSFHINAQAEELLLLEDIKDVEKLISTASPFYIIGGGTNILLTDDLPGIAVINRLKGKEIIALSKDTIELRAASGEHWHSFVQWTLSQGYGGLENLSLIPGTVGAAPIQNIGAYGVEAGELITAVHTIDIGSGAPRVFSAEQCKFAYRDSIFKQEAKGKYFITAVDFKLSRRRHRIVRNYWAIESWLKDHRIEAPDIYDISKAVIDIRSSKLPNPEKLGNAGSFFKNVEIGADKLKSLREKFPDIKYYEMAHGSFKIPTAWMIDRCGWKGKRIGDVGCHKDQALVLVNYGNASGRDIFQLAMEIKKDVKERFGLEITPEVNIWP